MLVNFCVLSLVMVSLNQPVSRGILLLSSHTTLRRSELDLTKEQLAQQHARVLSLQQRGVGEEEVCQERLAEQQLRLKQVRTCVRVGGNVCRNGVELYGLTALFASVLCCAVLYGSVDTNVCMLGCGCPVHAVSTLLSPP